MRKFRYDWYGALVGLGLPLVGTLIEALRHFGNVGLDALLAAHASQPLLWIMDTTPIVLGGLGHVIVRQHADIVGKSEEIVRQSRAIVELEAARRESFDRTAKDVSHAAQTLLGSVSAFRSTMAQAAAAARETTATMNQLSQTAASAALTAETVIGLAVQSERASADGLRHAERSGAELLQLADEVRELSRRVEELDGPMRQIMDAASRLEPSPDPRGSAELRRILSDVSDAMHAAQAAAERGSERARAGARLVTHTGDTIRGLATALRESARAAREIARVAQQQESGIEGVLKAMSEISLATDDTVASTDAVAKEAESLNALATTLRAAVKS